MFPRPRRIETELSRDVLNPARVTLSWANSPTLGTYSSPRMRRADIEVPNLAVDVNSWARSACYPRGSFYPLSHTPSTRKCGITKPDFRPCSARQPRSQAPFCLYTLCGWCPFTLREPLGASVTFWEATAPVKLPAWPCLRPGSRRRMRHKTVEKWYFTAASTLPASSASPAPTYPTYPPPRLKAKV